MAEVIESLGPGGSVEIERGPARQASTLLAGSASWQGASNCPNCKAPSCARARTAVEAHDNKQPPLCLPKAHVALLPCWPLLMPIAPAAPRALLLLLLLTGKLQCSCIPPTIVWCICNYCILATLYLLAVTFCRTNRGWGRRSLLP